MDLRSHAYPNRRPQAAAGSPKKQQLSPIFLFLGVCAEGTNGKKEKWRCPTGQ